MMLVADQITKYYGQRRALDQLSISIDAGEVVGFVGPNGAGKTTALKILGGAIAPSAGRLHIDGVDCRRFPRELRRRVGFLPDRPPLYNEMSVRAMLAYSARLNGLGPARSRQRVDEVLEICALESVSEDLVAWLSHGYRQRVGIAQAIVHEPQLLILDEPTSGLDPRQIVEARKLLQQLARRHTVLVSSHILAELEQSCDRFLFLHQGRIIAKGGAEELRAQLPLGQFRVSGSGKPAEAVEIASGCAGLQDVALADSRAGQYELHARALDDAAREQLVARLVEAGLGVARLESTDASRLESVFLELTREAAA